MELLKEFKLKHQQHTPAFNFEERSVKLFKSLHLRLIKNHPDAK
jgi:hypothetical protein